MDVDDHQIAIYVYIAIILLIVIGIPCVLMGMLLYHGLRLDWHDLVRGRDKRRAGPRGFDVVAKADETPPERNQHEDPRIPGPPDPQ